MEIIDTFYVQFPIILIFFFNIANFIIFKYSLTSPQY